MKQNLSIAWSWTKKSLKTPALWTEFLECIHKKKGTLHVLCRYCHRSYAHPSKIGKDTADGNQNFNGPTTSISRHLKECNLYKVKQLQSQSSMTSFLSTNESQIGQNDLLSKVLQFFISANIPFNMADNPYFQELIQTAQRLQSQVSYSHLLVLIQLSPSVPSIHFNGFTVHAFDFLSKMSPLLTSRMSEQGLTVSCEGRARGGLRSLGS